MTMTVTVRKLLLGSLLMLPGAELPGAELPAAEQLSVAELETAASQGDKVARTLLAGKYELADGVGRDFLKANYLYCQAARSGYAEAQVNLGLIYANGRAIPRNPRIAAGLFSLAAAQGHERGKRLLQFMVEQLHVEPEMQTPECMLPQPTLTLRLTRELSDVARAESAKAGKR